MKAVDMCAKAAPLIEKKDRERPEKIEKKDKGQKQTNHNQTTTKKLTKSH